MLFETTRLVNREGGMTSETHRQPKSIDRKSKQEGRYEKKDCCATISVVAMTSDRFSGLPWRTWRSHGDEIHAVETIVVIGGRKIDGGQH